MAQVRILLQSRTSSSRLPGKSLLPIAGYPSAMLAGLRAKSCGRDVRLVTSTDSSDNALATTAEEHGLTVFRGTLNDVLQRFVDASSDLPDDAILVRLTADNVFPDGALIEGLLNWFENQDCHYLGTTWPEADLPYGLSAELFRAGTLRSANQHASSSLDREHVTPWIIRNYRTEIYQHEPAERGLARLRCTIDTYHDYQRICRVFARVTGSPMDIPWETLCKELAALPDSPLFRIPAAKISSGLHSAMVLGTAQIGMPYGIANRTGMPDQEEARAIIRTAVEHGVTDLDTARAYGDSEEILGEALAGHWDTLCTVITKLTPLEELPNDAPLPWINDAVDASVLRSCRALKRQTLPVLLLHRAQHRAAYNGAIWDRLQTLSDLGVVSRLGVSVQTVPEALDALEDSNVTFLQLPLNLLDRRWQSPELLRSLSLRPDVTVHARSPFLQGLLPARDPSLWPRVPGVQPERWVSDIDNLVAELGRKDAADLCLAYARSHGWVHGVIVGIESQRQLDEVMESFTRPPLSAGERLYLEERLSPGPESLVNPALWTT